MLANNLKLHENDDDADDTDFKPAAGDDEDADDEDGDELPALAEAADGNDDVDMMDDEEEEEYEETEEEALFRDSILKSVNSLNAVYPDPSSDLLWVKRTLKHAAASMHDARALAWYPWGIPPVEPLTRCVRSDDPLEKQYGLTILALYSQHFGAEEDEQN